MNYIKNKLRTEVENFWHWMEEIEERLEENGYFEVIPLYEWDVVVDEDEFNVSYEDAMYTFDAWHNIGLLYTGYEWNIENDVDELHIMLTLRTWWGKMRRFSNATTNQIKYFTFWFMEVFLNNAVDEDDNVLPWEDFVHSPAGYYVYKEFWNSIGRFWHRKGE